VSRNKYIYVYTHTHTSDSIFTDLLQINKFFCHSPTDAQQWSYQARSYDDSITYKCTIQIKVAFKMINDLKDTYKHRIF